MLDGKPLEGIKVVELASIGPGPFAAMMLADHGADVVRIEKPGGRAVGTSHFDKDPLLRGRKKVELDLKDTSDVAKALHLIEKADVVIEGFRPGVTERLGVGPEDCHALNPALVYGRMTGWGQDGPLADRAGHDINYIALTGALDAIGTKTSGPVPALNLIGDFGGGGMLLAYGICAALLPAKLSGKGTVIDASMVDGAALLMTMPYSLKAQGLWGGGRGNNLLDGGAPLYGTYQTSDEKWIALGAIEEPFWQEFLSIMEMTSPGGLNRMNPKDWPAFRSLIEQAFKKQSQEFWVNAFEGTDACVAPVLSMDEAVSHPHNESRNVLQTVDGVLQPAPAPRFSGVSPVAQRTDMTALDYSAVLKTWS